MGVVPMQDSHLVRRFESNSLSSDEVQVCQAIRVAGLEMATKINKNCHETREKNLAIRKIEEATMWANAAIARHGLMNQIPEQES